MILVVSDASPLHYLIECGEIGILEKLFGDVRIPPEVFRELQQERTPLLVREWMRKPPGWLTVQAPAAIDQQLNLHAGEKEAISLALEIHATALLIDDRRGRAEATRRGLRVAGTIGLLEAAGRSGLIDFNQAIAKQRQTRARLDQKVINAAMERLKRPG